MQSVPNSVAKGPHGGYYVGELTGFPFPTGGARVYLVNPGQAPQILADAFTNIIDLALARAGSVYVLQITKDGLLAAEQGDMACGPNQLGSSVDEWMSLKRIRQFNREAPPVSCSPRLLILPS
jgi:hypothetical protein